MAGSASAACWAAVPVRLEPAEVEPVEAEPVASMLPAERVVAAAAGRTAPHWPIEGEEAVELLLVVVVEEEEPTVELEEVMLIVEPVAKDAPDAPGAAPLLPARSSVVKLLKPFAASTWATLILVAVKGVVNDWTESWFTRVEPRMAGSINGVIPRRASVVGSVGSLQRVGTSWLKVLKFCSA